MPRPAGTSKTGGRKRGTPNRRTGQLVDQLAALNLDILAEIAKTLPDLDVETRVGVLMDFMQYLFPKRKALEISEPEKPEDRNIQITFVDPETKCVSCSTVIEDHGKDMPLT